MGVLSQTTAWKNREVNENPFVGNGQGVNIQENKLTPAETSKP